MMILTINIFKANPVKYFLMIQSNLKYIVKFQWQYNKVGRGIIQQYLLTVKLDPEKHLLCLARTQKQRKLDFVSKLVNLNHNLLVWR